MIFLNKLSKMKTIKFRTLDFYTKQNILAALLDWEHGWNANWIGSTQFVERALHSDQDLGNDPSNQTIVLDHRVCLC